MNDRCPLLVLINVECVYLSNNCICKSIDTAPENGDALCYEIGKKLKNRKQEYSDDTHK